ncbi:glycerophosphodiester phosphodiesterase family protein [Streptomyces sp. DSM 44915]|uniref:Glycerophosphodiester phosphodiesterase family protein n=1 Tax=Streptomyces chisholmiae TaxID=3075540 RepID=A0ABU2JLW4_9ACTN|nr:glycerophosphodiester phosphodiesterase family protein [Streptomyces sp. DSM 44915]MDT0265955.1 glycerophosphodiester phosphodiesterase family protein [Streptomyces sp. DSM 44915]
MSLLTVGHRGLMGVEPENTLRSFRRARRAGLDAIELDLRLSRDGALVVLHDARVDRTTDGRGAVAELTLAELRALDAGRGERVPLLAEVVAEIDGPLQLEIKDVAAAGELAAFVDRHGLTGRVTVISFHDVALAAFAAALPAVPRGLVTGTSTATAPERAAALGCALVSCALPRLDAEVVTRCRAAGLPVLAWTVNTEAELARARELGLAGVVTDRPEIVRAARSAG